MKAKNLNRTSSSRGGEPKMPKAVISVSLPLDLAAMIAEEARVRGCSVSRIATEAVSKAYNVKVDFTNQRSKRSEQRDDSDN